MEPILKVVTKNKKLTESDILEFEKKLEILLPNDYRNFMLLNNG